MVLTWWFGDAPNFKSRQTTVGFCLTTARNSGGNVIKYDLVYILLISSIWARDRDLLMFRISLRGSTDVGFFIGRSTTDVGVVTGGDCGVIGEGGGGPGSRSVTEFSVSCWLSDRDDIGGDTVGRKCCTAVVIEPRDTLCTTVVAKESSDMVGAVVAIELFPSSIADATAAGELPDAAERPDAVGTVVARERPDTVGAVMANESPDSSDWIE